MKKIPTLPLKTAYTTPQGAYTTVKMAYTTTQSAYTTVKMACTTPQGAYATMKRASLYPEHHPPSYLHNPPFHLHNRRNSRFLKITIDKHLIFALSNPYCNFKL